MKENIGHRAILISGPTSGLGLQLSKLLSRRELPLLLVGRNLSRLNVHIDMQKANVHSIECDLASVAEVTSAQKLAGAIFSALTQVQPHSIFIVSNAGAVEPIGCTTESEVADLVCATAVIFWLQPS